MSEDTTKSDLEDHIEQHYLAINISRTVLQDAFKKLNEFYAKNPDDDIIYQYEQESQKEFMEQQQVISERLESVYPVVRDINETFKISQSGVTMQPQQQQTTGTSIYMTQPEEKQKKPSFWSRYYGGEKSTVPSSLEDAWMMTKEWTITTMNIPNLWQKFLNFHHSGKIRYEILPEGMRKYLSLEIWYLNSVIEPLVTRMVQRGLVLMEEKSLDNINRAYGVTLAHEEKMEQMKMYQQQSGGFGKTEPTH